MSAYQPFDTAAELQTSTTRRVTAMLDRHGRILATHALWLEAAAGAPAIFQIGVRDNLIERWSEYARAGDRQAGRIVAGLESLLDGAGTPLELEYVVPG